MSAFVELGKVVKSLTKSVRSTTVANYVLAKAIKVIATLPTTDIVRCKDCKYWAEFTFAQPPKNYCGRLIQADYNNHDFGFEMDADDFCSQGEKRDE